MANTTYGVSGYQDNMTILLNKIERRLGLIPLTPHLENTPYSKDKWADVVVEDTIPTFSRYYPRKIPFKINSQTAPKKDGWYYIDEKFLGKMKILGIGDLDWTAFNNRSLGLAQQFGYGLPDVGMTNFSMSDIETLTMRANYASMFNNNVYPEFQEPNKIRLTAIANQDLNIGEFTIFLYVTHSDDLKTISPTKMETFEQLAIADVATFLSRNLKYWDGLETVFATLDLKMSDLENEASKRDQIIDKLEQSYVLAGNDAIPVMMTV